MHEILETAPDIADRKGAVSLPVRDVWVAGVFVGNRAEQDDSRERLSVGFRAARFLDKRNQFFLILGCFLDTIKRFVVAKECEDNVRFHLLQVGCHGQLP